MRCDDCAEESVRCVCDLVSCVGRSASPVSESLHGLYEARCAVCGESCRVGARLRVDRVEGKVRGLWCARCREGGRGGVLDLARQMYLSGARMKDYYPDIGSGTLSWWGSDRTVRINGRPSATDLLRSEFGA